MNGKQKTITLLILFAGATLLFFYLSSLYLKSQQAAFEIEVQEHGKLLAEPLWNYDSLTINSFVSIVSLREDYGQVRIFGENELLYDEKSKIEKHRIHQALTFLHLINEKNITSEIKRDENVIGKIEVLWRDRSAINVFIASIFYILVLLLITLYFRIIKINSSLKSNLIELNTAVAEIKEKKDFIEQVYNVVPEGLFVLDGVEVSVANKAFIDMISHWSQRLKIAPQEVQDILIQRLVEEINQADSGEYSVSFERESINLQYALSYLHHEENDQSKVICLEDISEMTALQNRLNQAEKLEAVGRLAAGIAHEINTPAQYVLSNMEFFSESTDDLWVLLNKLYEMSQQDKKPTADELFTFLDQQFDEVDWEFIAEEIPEGIDQSIEGLTRIKSIVDAMKTFAHPSGTTLEPQDINLAVQTTVTVTSNEWKHVAAVEFDLDDNLPHVPCLLDQLNQVMLNMIINAVHAIEDRTALGEDGYKGTITIKTSASETSAHIAIGDNGNGMSEEVKNRVFEPFYTTKEVGKGSGQGLSIAYDIIEKQHHGNIQVNSETGVGTTFTITLPLQTSRHETT